MQPLIFPVLKHFLNSGLTGIYKRLSTLFRDQRKRYFLLISC